MFGLGKSSSKTAPKFGARLVGEWRAEAVRGDVVSHIFATFNGDGTFHIRTEVENGGHQPPRSQFGRYRVEAIDKERFRIITIDEFGSPTGSSVRRYIDENTMLNELGQITFQRVLRS